MPPPGEVTAMIRTTLLASVLALLCSVAVFAAKAPGILPSGWRLDPPAGPLAATGTMPQGLAVSPDGRLLAVVESGFNPPALSLFAARGLRGLGSIPLPGAFGKPVWIDAAHVLVAGANADAFLVVDVARRTVREHRIAAGAWPDAVAIAPDHAFVAASDDGDGTITLAAYPSFGDRRSISVGPHPGDVLFSHDGATLYVAMRGARTVKAIDVATGTASAIAVGLHPSALALSGDGSRLYVAESDDDAVGAIDTRTGRRVAEIAVGLHDGRLSGYGASPNALWIGSWPNSPVFASLGAENAVAVIRNDRVVERIPTGWYPTGVALGRGDTLFVSDGKGEGMRANPQFNPYLHRDAEYVATTLYGSVRAIPLDVWRHARAQTADVVAAEMPTWHAPAISHTVVRPHGPIRHVIYVIKENRSYDQVLGDLRGADGDPHLVWFGENITPNQHAIARRFGILDRAFTNSQVSADGHNWTDAAIANDYVERFWPVNYAGRRRLYDFQDGLAPDVPHAGYLWDAARRAGITYRDYGEDVIAPKGLVGPATTDMTGLTGHFDPRYYGWSLKYSDRRRLAEWLREFDAYAANGGLPQLEIVYLPNDHTAGTDPGAPTPQAYVATNDWCLGRLVDAVSHSRYWKSTAIFSVEDDAQDGPDHVSDQRSTFYVASPYAKAGVHHDDYSTAGVLHTIELILGIAPMTIYDATARPLYAAFGMRADLRPFDVLRPRIDLRAVNARTAYDAAVSAHLNWNRPDAVDPALLNRILAHAAGKGRVR